MRWVVWSSLVWSACADDGSFVVDRGIIVNAGPVSPPIDHPTSAGAGTEIAVTVMTYGDSCVSPERTEVDVRGLEATVQPFDRRNVTSQLCDDGQYEYPHEVVLRFDEPGSATITVIGRDNDPATTVIERTSTLQIE